MALPVNVSFGTVTGRFLTAAADSPVDQDRDPEGTAATDLSIVFAPNLSPAVVRDASATPPTVFALAPVTATVGATGDLLGPDGQPGIRLVATTGTTLDPSGWTWKATLASPSFPTMSFSFSLDPGQAIDLASVVQVPASPGATLAAWLQAVTDAQAARDAAQAAAASVPSAATQSALDRSNADALLRRVNATKIVTPPATLALYGATGLSAWFWPNNSVGDRFTLDSSTAFAHVALPVGGTGNFEVAIYATSKNADGSFGHAKMATTGIVPLSNFTPNGQNEIVVPFQDTPTLPPGEYTLTLWADAQTQQFAHALSNDLKAARLGLASIEQAGGMPEYISTDYPSGRAFIAVLLPLATPAAGTAVLMGDSITAAQTWFDTANYRVDRRWTAVNQGNPGEITAQMVARFGAALAANPKLVVIFGGANDVGQGLDPQTTIGNLQTMRDQALAAGARVIMATVMPRGFLTGDADPAVGNAAIATINAWLRGQDVADVSLADWHDAMATGDGVTYRPELFNDHVHPGVRGQRIMASVLSPLL